MLVTALLVWGMRAAAALLLLCSVCCRQWQNVGVISMAGSIDEGFTSAGGCLAEVAESCMVYPRNRALRVGTEDYSLCPFS